MTTRFPARNPAFDVTPAAPDHGDRDRGGRPPRAVRGVAARAGALAVILDEVDPGSRAILEAHGFDAEAFERLRRELADGTLRGRGNVVQGVVEPPLAVGPDAAAGAGRARLRRGAAVGVEALRAGRIAMVVLAGGMATRFGGGVKAVAEALDGRSFLEVKLGETERLGKALGAEIPVVLMTSFATDAVVRAHVAERGLGEPLWFCQTAAPRLRPDGSLFLEDDGGVALRAGPRRRARGIRSSGTLAELERRGVESVVVSNVDNLGARLDPVVVGMHLLAGTPLTVEVVAKGNDTGGAPARVDGRPQLLEAMRFPPDVRPGADPGLQHEHLTDHGRRAAEPVELTWLVVEKTVDEQPVVQFERLYHELSAHVPTTFLVVPRHGPRGRFLPVKEPADLAEVAAAPAGDARDSPPGTRRRSREPPCSYSARLTTQGGSVHELFTSEPARSAERQRLLGGRTLNSK